MPARMGSFLTGVVHRQLEMVSRALLRVESSFFVWELLHQTGAQYSATEKTSAWVGMCRVLVEAPHMVPARQWIRAMWDIVLADRFSRCWRNIREQSSLTPRYVGEAWNWSMLLLTMMLSSWPASLLLRWNMEDMVLATESFMCQFFWQVGRQDVHVSREPWFDCLPALV